MAAKTKTAAAKSAAAEAKNTPVIVEFLGATFECAATLPATFALDAVAIANGDEGALHRVVQSVFNADQIATIRELLSSEQVDDAGMSLLGDLFTAVAAAYGVDEGE